jgi:hypothetical protein
VCHKLAQIFCVTLSPELGEFVIPDLFFVQIDEGRFSGARLTANLCSNFMQVNFMAKVAVNTLTNLVMTLRSSIYIITVLLVTLQDVINR